MLKSVEKSWDRGAIQRSMQGSHRGTQLSTNKEWNNLDNRWGMNGGYWDQSIIVPGAHPFQLEAEAVLLKRPLFICFLSSTAFAACHSGAPTTTWGTLRSCWSQKSLLLQPVLVHGNVAENTLLCLSLKPRYKTQMWLKEAKEVLNHFLPLTDWSEFISRWLISSGWTNLNTGWEARDMRPWQSNGQSWIDVK